MTAQFDLIDTFSRRPSLLPLAVAELRAALAKQYPTLTINPETARITRVNELHEFSSRTLIDCLRENFATGKTPQWKTGENTLVADPAPASSDTYDLDIEQLAVLIDSVSLSLPTQYMHAVIEFWDSAQAGSLTPWQQLANALQLQSQRGMQRQDASAPEDFERKALEALEAQLPQILDVLSMDLGDFDEIERYLAKITDIRPLLQDRPMAIRELKYEQLPAWLIAASPADRLDYSRRLCALSVTASRAAGQAWNDNLPPILDYANRAMQDALRDDYPQATWITFDDVTVHIAKVVASAAPLAGQIMPIGSVEHIRMSVAAFALGNLSSLPSGTITLSTRDGGPLPGWLTPSYLKQLVVRVDIGRTYPERVRQYLIADKDQVTRRRDLFADQLRVQLPLKALEQKIRGQGGMTQGGYRRVCSLLEAQGRTPPADSVLRPLSWRVRPGATPDLVSNMFVIGAQDTHVGPFVLYRPFAATPFAEYQTWGDLREAIAAPGELQDEVLTWMTERGRQRYANGGFNEPHIVRFGQGLEFAPIETPAPALLGDVMLQGDLMMALFDSNARALVDLADRESVSNAESRWEMIRRGGWLALEAVMPFLSGSVGAAVWLVQLMAGVDQVLAAERRKAGRERIQAWNALLLTLSMILLHYGFKPRARLGGHALKPYSQLRDDEAGTDSSAAHDINDASVQGARPQLDFSWSSARHQLTPSQARSLEAMKVTPEPALGPASQEAGTTGLYRHDQRWWARLDSGLYEVSVTDEGVHIIGAFGSRSQGPRLRYAEQSWVLDLSLGLRGGGPKRTAKLLAQENAATLKRVTERCAMLNQERRAIYRKFFEWDKLFKTGEPLTPQRMELIDSDLNELKSIVEETTELQSSLRPADRAGEKFAAKDLQALCRRMIFFEGVVLDHMVKLARIQFPKLQFHSVGSVTAQNIDAYLRLFEELLTLENIGVHWSAIREGFWQQLRAVPKVGEQYWREEVLELQRTQLLTHLEWRTHRLWSLLELSFTRDSILQRRGELEIKSLRQDEALQAAFSSQAELEKPNDYSLTEQIEVLESSLREYQRANLIATCAREGSMEAFNAERFGRFMDDLEWVRDRAENRLSDLIRESAEPPATPSKYAPRIKQPRKRVIKTRSHHTLVGSLKEGEPDMPGAVVEVKQARNETVVGTYHLHENGEWVEVESQAPPSKPETSASHDNSVGLAELKRQAVAGLERVEMDINAARRQSGRSNEPADMQDILVHRAEKLTALADRLDSRRTDANQTGSAATALQAQIDALRAAAARLVTEGRTLRIAMIKASPPTATRLSYLAAEGEVSIARFDGRKNMSGARRNDFLQEYVIRDNAQRVLWWAHFHYTSEGAAADAFSAAHLKLPAQRFIGYKAQVKAAKDNGEVVSIYRSYIGKEIAQRLFLDMEPAAHGD